MSVNPLLAQLLISAALCTSAVGQTTWIVDQAGGAGSNFTDLPAAEAAAQAGDVIIVRPGQYSAFTTSKGLDLRFALGAEVRAGSVLIDSLPANESFIIAGLNGLPSAASAELVLRSNLGRVHLDRSQFDGVTIERSTQVTFSECQIDAPGLTLSDGSRVTASGCTLRGAGASIALSRVAGAGVRVFDSLLVLAQSRVQGGDGVAAGGVVFNGAAGIVANASAIVLAGDAGRSLVASGLNANLMNRTEAIRSTRCLVQPGRSQLIGGIRGSFVELQGQPAGLTASGAPPGDSVYIELAYGHFTPFVLFIGVPGQLAATSIGILGLDLGTIAPILTETTSGFGLRSASVPIPAVSQLEGFALGIQAIVLDGVRGAQLSNHVVVTLN